MTIINYQSFKHSIVYASRGLTYVFRHEQNFRIQIFIAAIVLLCGYFFDISKRDLLLILMLIAGVLILELVNTVLEYFLNVVEPKIHIQAKIIKDIMAGAVLLMSLAAAVLGTLIFWPYVF
ncbi:MAG: diacylglycerol kinase family protein [Patescibacteria group bacterium]|jgi:diacylglycerol kinase